MAAPGTRSVRKRHLGAHPRISCSDARRGTKLRLAGSERTTGTRFHPLHPGTSVAGYSEHRPKSCRKPSLCLHAMRGHDHSNRAFRPVAWPASRSIRWILRRCGLTGCARSRSNAISACTRSVLNVDHLPSDLTVSSFGPKMARTKCGTIGTDVRPNWRERQRRRQNCHRAGLRFRGAAGWHWGNR
jgi:hypothetical protein